MKLIVDLSSILGAFLHLNDPEYGTDITHQGKSFHIPHNDTSLERFQHSIELLDIPLTDCIIVKDPGGLPRCRTRLLKTYKQSDRSAPMEFFEARKELFETATEWLKSQGAIITTPKNSTEADDLINEFAQRFDDCYVWTRDKDMLAIPNAKILYQDKDGQEVNPIKFPVEREFIHAYRCIVLGDKSDNVDSCKGFGEKAWEKMIDIFGEGAVKDLDEMLRDKTLHTLQPLVDQFPKFQLMIDQAKELYVIYQVMSFFPVPAHEVKWEGGMLIGDKTLVTADNFDEVLSAIKELQFDFAVIDYEADTCAESRAWAEQAEIVVDVIGQEITGMGLRIHSHNWYFSVDHCDTNNITLQQLEKVLEVLWGKVIYAHNASFENTLTYNHFGVLLPNMIDTQIMGAYVDENDYTNLKHLSKRWLDYQQATYKETLGDKSGMREISGLEVVSYGIDDVITTDAIRNLFETILTYEGTLKVFHQVENDALYFTTLCFINGVDFDREAFDQLKKTNDENIERSWALLSDRLLDLGWEGGEFTPITSLNLNTLNTVHNTVYGCDTPKVTGGLKSVANVLEDRQLAEWIIDKDLDHINELYESYWVPGATFNVRSPTQMNILLYDVLKCPIRIRNKATEKMRKEGKQGNPASDETAINNAIAYNDTPDIDTLKLLVEYKGYLTKESLFLEKYPKYVHWKTGKIHASQKQSSTTTRRPTCSSPNLLQLPKRQGREFRNMLKAMPGYSFVTLDFTGQELCLAADDSRDENFLACYIGDNKKDPHAITGLKIAHDSGETWSYEEFEQLLSEKDESAKSLRTLGKKINFVANYGSMAPKVAHTLCITEEDAQSYLDARANAFPRLLERVKEWHKICGKLKYAATMLGGRRHLSGHKYYDSKKEFERQAADRLAYSMRIQGSAAEMTKIATGRMYSEGLLKEGEAYPVANIYDEVVLLVRDDLIDGRMPRLVEIMCAKYADMIVPMSTDPEVGKNFGTLEKYKMVTV